MGNNNRWLEVRIAIGGPVGLIDLNQLGKTFEEVLNPLYKQVTSLDIVNRCCYLHEPSRMVEILTKKPYEWMLRCEVKDWKNNESTIKSDIRRLLAEKNYSEVSGPRDQEIKTYFFSADDGSGEADTFTEEYYPFFYDFMNAVCKLHEGMRTVDKTRFNQFIPEKLVHCMLNAFGYAGPTERNYHLESLITRYLIDNRNTQLDGEAKKNILCFILEQMEVCTSGVPSVNIANGYSHIIRELRLDNIVVSLEGKYDQIQQTNSAIHEFAAIAALFPPTQDSSLLTKSAFLLYQWEIINAAHRSLLEALCAYYNAAFTLLRTTLELSIKGAFYECLAHKKYRDDARILNSKNWENLKKLIDEAVTKKPELEHQLEANSAAIYDLVGLKISEKDYQISINAIVKQLREWKILEGIPENLIYKEIYEKLCEDVHLTPDRTDVGRSVKHTADGLFENNAVITKSLNEFLDTCKKVVDTAIVIELNILKENVETYEYDAAIAALKDRLLKLDDAGLELSNKRVRNLIKEFSAQLQNGTP